MNKYIFTFGSNQLKGLGISPMSLMLVIEAPTEHDARQRVFESFIGNKFAFSYDYDKMQEFKDKYGMREISLEELEKLHAKEVEASHIVLKAWIADADDDTMEAIGYGIMSDGPYSEEGKQKARESFNRYLEGFHMKDELQLDYGDESLSMQEAILSKAKTRVAMCSPLYNPDKSLEHNLAILSSAVDMGDYTDDIVMYILRMEGAKRE